MAVAKSYQTLEQTCEPYEVSGKMYVKVRMKSGAEKQVRWYTNKEWAKMYPEEVVNKKQDNTFYRTQKEVLGFEKGYIWIFKGDTYSNLEYFRSKKCYFTYNKWFGWNLASDKEIPEDIPSDLTPIQLSWELVGNDKGELQNDKVIEAVVNSLLLDPTKSEYQGTIGERIEIKVTIQKRIVTESNFGLTNIHIMLDENENEYVWATAAKTLNEGETYKLRGTIKEHKLYKASKQTVLTRCTVL